MPSGKFLYFGDKDTGLTENTNIGSGYIFLNGTSGATIPRGIAAPGELDLYSNTAVDGSGNWEPYIAFQASGVTQIYNRDQGATGSKYLEIFMTDGVKIYGASTLGNIWLKTDNVTSPDITFQFPNTGGTIATTANIQTLYDKVVASSGGDYTTLGAALAAATAGETIFVRNGNYTETSSETVSVDNVTVIGESNSATIIDLSTYTFTFSGTFASLKNIQFTGTTGGIDLSGANSSILNSQFLQTGSGSAATFLTSSGNETLIDGIYFNSASTSTTTYMNISGNNIILTKSTIVVSANPTYGVTLGCDYSDITSNNFIWYNSGANYIVGLTAFNNNFANNQIYGDSTNYSPSGLYDAGVNNVNGNFISYCTYGAKSSSGDNTFINNFIRDCTIGIDLRGVQIFVAGNTFIGSSTMARAINVYGVTYGVYTNNNVANYPLGIEVFSSSTSGLIANNNLISCTTEVTNNGTSFTVVNNL